MNRYTYTTQPQLRAAFWAAHPDFDRQARTAGIRGKPQNEHCAAVRYAWCDFIDAAARNGDISEALARRATL